MSTDTGVSVGMPEAYQNASVAQELRDTNRGNPQGDVVDNTAGALVITPNNPKDASSGNGAYISMQSRPSWLY